MTAVAQPGATSADQLTGDRNFTWFTPARRRASEYENYTIGQQSTPDQWLHIDWPVRFDDGRAPWEDSSSRVVTTLWQNYRDPAAVWQRPYVATTNQDQQALARLVPILTRGNGAAIAPSWSKEVLGRTYGAWPFVEYGLFLALSYGVRQAMSDTVQFAVVFQAADRLRLLQDIVFHLDHLAEDCPGFTDAGARDAWMSDPALVPIREIVEHIVASEDWVEALVVAALVFEPLIGRLAKAELFSQRAVFSGDGTTPAVLAGSLRDSARSADAVAELVKLVCSDPVHGAANRAVIDEWVDTWGARCAAAAQAFLPSFTAAGASDADRDAALARASAHQQTVLAAALGGTQ